MQLKSRLVCMLSQSYIIFKHDFLLTQRKKLNQQQKQPLQETAFQIQYSRNSEKKTKKQSQYRIFNMPHCSLGKFPFTESHLCY